MAKKKKVDEKSTEEQVDNNVKENVTKVDMGKFKSKDDDNVVKVDLNKKPEETNQPKEETNETKEEITNDNTDDGGVVEIVENTDTPQEQEKVQPKEETQENVVLEEVTDVEEKVEEVAEVVEEAINEAIETGNQLPENIEKLMEFMDQTGGDLTDYVKLSKDYSSLDNQELLYEYYKQTKPHLDTEEISFLMEDQFSYDEEIDENKDIKRKKLALKEQVANARKHLDGLKSKYYEDIKGGSRLTIEQREAIDFYNTYNEESSKNEDLGKKQRSAFEKATNNVFSEEFKGFEYKIGDKRFRFNVKDANKVKKTQSDINNFVGKFLDKNKQMKDAKGYHKSIFTAMNPDAIANHFYEQGKADALKESIANAKNVSMDPRQSFTENVNTSGIKVRALDSTGPSYKFQIKNK